MGDERIGLRDPDHISVIHGADGHDALATTYSTSMTKVKTITVNYP